MAVGTGRACVELDGCRLDSKTKSVSFREKRKLNLSAVLKQPEEVIARHAYLEKGDQELSVRPDFQTQFCIDLLKFVVVGNKFFGLPNGSRVYFHQTRANAQNNMAIFPRCQNTIRSKATDQVSSQNAEFSDLQ